jgi:hypothetical protein
MATTKTKPAAPATPKPRKPREKSMTLVEKHKMITRVIESEATMPDATVADLVGASFGRKVSAAQVAEWRKQFGLKSVPRPSVAQLQAHIEALQAHIEALQAQVRALDQVPVPTLTVAAPAEAAPVPVEPASEPA